MAILEGDDTWPATKLEDQLPLFDDPAVVLTYGSAGLMDERGCIYARYWHAPDGRVGVNDPVGIILPALVRLNFIVAPTVMVRRWALDRIGGFLQPAGIPYVDHPTWLRLATTGTFARSPRLLGNWRRYPLQVTTRSWFGAAPDRASYLQAVRDEAREVVSADVLAALDSVDPPRSVSTTRGGTDRARARGAPGRSMATGGGPLHATRDCRRASLESRGCGGPSVFGR